MEPDRPEVFEQRAEILSPLGRINEAVNDLTKAIQLQPSARLYRHRGTLYFISEDYATAHEDFQQSLELNKNQPIAMLYKGLTFFHRGLLKNEVESCAVIRQEPRNQRLLKAEEKSDFEELWRPSML